MPPLLMQDAYDRARFFLNDMGVTIFTDLVMLEAIKSANDDLSDALVTNGIPVQKTVQKAIPYIANTEYLDLSLVDDIIVPIRLWERASGSVDQYTPMTRSNWPIETQPGNTLVYWDWREQLVHLLPANLNRDVRLDYTRMLTSISGPGSRIEVNGALNYLAYKAASLAADSIGGNQAISDKLLGKANFCLDRLLNIGVRNNQANPRRRRAFRISGIRRFF